ncbi:hypothetical protein [Streptomyces phage phiScoe55]|nr:hypothetical protein [Streptomyces phage phiScoe55]
MAPERPCWGAVVPQTHCTDVVTDARVRRGGKGRDSPSERGAGAGRDGAIEATNASRCSSGRAMTISARRSRVAPFMDVPAGQSPVGQ